MSYPDADLTSLAKIRIKVRKLTRSLSENHLSTASLDDFINSFILFDLPRAISTEALEERFVFFTKSYVQEYETDTTNENSLFYNFDNKYVYVSPNAFLSGNQLQFYTSEREFQVDNESPAAVKSTDNTGDGVEWAFEGTLSSFPVLPRRVSFSSITADNEALNVFDVPFSGSLTGGLYSEDSEIERGTINYVTGVYEFAFENPPAKGETIYSETISYAATKPSSILYASNSFSFWPVPDKSYRVEIVAKSRPTKLLESGDVPEISAWWEYIAYGASKKVFEDRADMKSLEAIMPEFNRQEALIEKRKCETLSCQRTPTIYNI